MSQIQVISGDERRRRWSDEQKRAIVAAAFAPGAVVTKVAQQADVNTGLVYRWRRQLGGAPARFAEVVVSPAVAGPVDRGGAPVEVMVAGAQLRIPATTPPDLAAAIVAALVRR